MKSIIMPKAEIVEGKAREFYIVDEIAADTKRLNWATGEFETIESGTSQKFFARNLEGCTPADEVHLYINCIGGSVKESVGICSLLRRCPAKTVAHVDGYACSGASLIAASCDHVIMPRNTAQMVHNARWTVTGNPAELRKSAADLEVVNLSAMQTYLQKGKDKLPPEKLVELLNGETWLSAEDCLRYGLADEYGEQDANLEAAATAFKAAMEKAQGTAEAKLYDNPPTFLAAALAKLGPTEQNQEPSKTPATQEAQKPIKNEPEAKAQNTPAEPKKPAHSSIYKLLEAMTK